MMSRQFSIVSYMVTSILYGFFMTKYDNRQTDSCKQMRAVRFSDEAKTFLLLVYNENLHICESNWTI